MNRYLLAISLFLTLPIVEGFFGPVVALAVCVPFWAHYCWRFSDKILRRNKGEVIDFVEWVLIEKKATAVTWTGHITEDGETCNYSLEFKLLDELDDIPNAPDTGRPPQ